LVGSGQCSIVAATNGSQRVGGWNPSLKVIFSFEMAKKCGVVITPHRPNDEFVAAIEE